MFLAGNGLPARLVPGFHVAELGFGTGLNLLALAQVAMVPVRFTSFEDTEEQFQADWIALRS